MAKLYEPKQCVATGAWHAARRVPGTPEMWSAEVECGSETLASEACEQLNFATDNARRELKEDARLRGRRA